MKTYLDCIPCFIKQTLEACRTVSDDVQLHEHLLREVLSATSGMDLQSTPPAMATQIHRMIRKMTGNRDPYLPHKQQANELAQSLMDELREVIRSADCPFDTAVRLAIAGNIIDCGIIGHDYKDIHGAIDRALANDLCGDPAELQAAAAEAKSILYLADNAGEIFLDRLLVEQLPQEKITLAVRGGPILNDATYEDAQAAGLTEMVTVIDNGHDAPGTILDKCSEDFQRQYAQADMIIAKGQGNYETLSDRPENIFFLLQAKCPVIAEHLNCPVGSNLVFHQSRQ